jgi:hypothetical protein
MHHPPRALGLIIGISAMVLLTAANLLFVAIIWRTPVNFLTSIWVILILISLPVLAVIVYRTFSLINAQYLFTQNALVIVWGPVRQIIPMDEIAGLIAGNDIGEDLSPRGLWWPGCLVGRGHTAKVGDLMYYATTPQRGQIIVATGAGGYVISPADVKSFIESFESEGRKGPEAEIEYEVHRPEFYEWGIWKDRLALILIGSGVVLPFLLLIAVSIRVPSLADEVALHFDTAGHVDRLGSPIGLFILPAIGGLVWLINSMIGGAFYVRQAERPAAYLLWFGSTLVQVFLWVAAFGLLL